MRGRRYSYSPSPSPPRGAYEYDGGRRRRRNPSPSPSPSPKEGGGHYHYGRSRGRDLHLPTSLLVRNLRHDCRPQDLRGLFGEFGPLKDVYLPRDYHTRAPRGFGFVQFVDPDDAAEAKYEMDGHILLGRELTVVFAEENRKKPSEMRSRERFRGRSYDRSGSPLRDSRSPRYGRSYSRSPRYAQSYSHSRVHYSPSLRRGQYSRSNSPRGRRYREWSYSYSPPSYGSRSRSPSGSRSQSLDYSS